MHYKLASKLLSINILNNITPLLTLLILKKNISTNDFSEFIINYSLIIFFISIGEFGFRNYFLTMSGVSQLNVIEIESSDRLRLTFISLTIIIIFGLVLLLGNYNILFFIPLLIKEYFFPIYKYQNFDKLKTYNSQLLIYQIIIILGLVSTFFTKNTKYLYIIHFLGGFYLIIKGYIFTNPKWGFFRNRDLLFLKKMIPIGLSNILTSINQNLYKSLLGFASPIILVNYEIIFKLVSIFKMPINFLTEYFQVKSNELNKIKFFVFPFLICLLAIISFYLFESNWVNYFDIKPEYLYVYSIILVPIAMNSLFHRVFLILKDKMNYQLISITLGSIFLISLTYLFSEQITLFHVIIISIFSETIILIVTFLLNYFTYGRKNI